MRDGCRVARVGHGPDWSSPLLVAAGDVAAPAEVLGPGGDDELLDDPVRIAGVSPHPPGLAPMRRRLNRVSSQRRRSGRRRCPGRARYSTVTSTGPPAPASGGQVRRGPVARGEKFLGRILEPAASPASGPSASPAAAMQRRGQPRGPAATPMTALPTALPPWNTTR